MVLVVCTGALPRPTAAGEDPAAGSEARRAGQKALEAGDAKAAERHFRRALREHPRSLLLLGDLLRATKDDPDVRTFWAHQYVAAASDKNGSAHPRREDAALLPAKDPELDLVRRARARAAEDLARAVASTRGPGASFLVRSLHRVFRRVADASPALEEAYAPAFEKAEVGAVPTVDRALADLVAHARRVRVTLEDAGDALALGRACLGLADQAEQDVPDRPAHAVPGLAETGRRLEADAEAALAARQMEPLAASALDAMGPDEVRRFNEAHTDVATPGRALSPHGRYRITTPCGHGTLAAAARLVEPVHARLVRWFGEDPFASERGEIRIFPEFSDLEAEAAPWWWADGFQGGRTTTVRFALGSIWDLAPLLTHELTHRFDAAVHPAMPAWLREGRAVFTAVAWQGIDDPAFVARAADVERIRNAWHTWYGTPEGLANLLRDGAKEYRDYYSAGHALWVYLLVGPNPEEDPLFTDRVGPWLAGMTRPDKDPVGTFTAAFCDGREGRPSSLDAFASGFMRFLLAFRGSSPPSWVSALDVVRPHTDASRIYDAPTVSRSRRRERPSFGQDQLLAAARSFAALGDPEVAVTLLEWAVAYDEPDAGDARLAERLLSTLGAADAARAAHVEAVRRGPREGEVPSRPLAAPRSVSAYVDALANAASDYARRGLVETACWFQDEQQVLARLVGTEPLSLPGLAFPAEPRVPFTGAGEALASSGWIPDELTWNDGPRDPDQWLITPEGHLVLGTKKLETLETEHREEFRSVFVRSPQRFEAGYWLAVRIRLLTPYVRAAVVLADARRDRNVCVEVGAGDTPDPDRGPQAVTNHAQVFLGVDGLRPFDEWAPPVGGGVVDLSDEDAANTVDLGVFVDGCRLDVYVKRKWVGRYVDPRGLPLDGAIGFATRGGAIRVESPVVFLLRRRDVYLRPLESGLDLARATRPAGGWAYEHFLSGFPTSPNGLFALWFPPAPHGAEVRPDDVSDEAGRVVDPLLRALDGLHDGARVVVALPAGWPAPVEAAVRARVKALPDGRVEVVRHAEAPAPAPPAPPAPSGETPVSPGTPGTPVAPTKTPPKRPSARLFFADACGIVRGYAESDLEDALRTWSVWLRLTRGF